MNELAHHLVDLPLWLSVLLKITVFLAAGWVVHYVVLNHNPRWRVLVWRVVFFGLAVVPFVDVSGWLEVRITRAEGANGTRRGCKFFPWQVCVA